MASAELLDALFEATLAVSAAVALVLLLRRVLRSAFGARVAYAAWWLVPAALVAVLLPAAVQPAVPMVVAPVTTRAVAAATPVVIAAPVDTSPWWLATWGVGATLLLLWMIHQQRRFHRAMGPVRARPDGLHEAAAVAGLPAAIGLVRPRVVVPIDFEQRYDADERALMQAHERLHIRAGDLHSNAFASALRCAFWFNPLVHVAWFAFRHDQELACDQRVIARYPHARRRYGEAMFKTQLAAYPLPLACHWGFGHPLKERIAMLIRPVPSRARIAGGVLLMTGLTLGVGFAAWSAQPASAPIATGTRELPEGHVMASIEARVDANQEESFVIANRAGEPFAISVGEGASAYRMEATMKPLSGDRIQLDAVLTQGGKVVGKPKLVVVDGKQAVIRIGEEPAPGAFQGVELAMKLSTRGQLPAAPLPPAPPAGIPSVPTLPAAAPPAPPAPPALAGVRGMGPPPVPAASPLAPANGASLPPVPPSDGARIVAKRIVVPTPEQAGGAPAARHQTRVRIKEVAPHFEGAWDPVAADGSHVCNGTVYTDEANGRFTCVPDANGAAAPPLSPASAPRAGVADAGATVARMSPPAYPKGESLEGRVMLEVDVRADGEVAAVAVARSSGQAVLDNAAREAVMKWRFNPAYSAGAAVASRVRVPIDFGPIAAYAGEGANTLEAIQVNR
ncbi:TonB family protein [Aerolutibacter ruishenii]|uniref:TonB family protein n=1 Tax=Aerolutibacter ruishenii TaxID=686800 RepID=A0A562LK19_9GAMM|nr:TonB family protein [Lysobacter ruishenii]TWI07957.1 TonB family protein [Lysobacter ruishenii]